MAGTHNGPRPGPDVGDQLTGQELYAVPASRDQWEEAGRRNTLLPPDYFDDDLASNNAYTDEVTGATDLANQRRGRESRALLDVVNGSCQGWRTPPTGAELYDAFRATAPTTRQLALIRTWFVECELLQLVEAWTQQAYTARQLVAAIHRAGLNETELPHLAVRIRMLNAWANLKPCADTDGAGPR